MPSKASVHVVKTKTTRTVKVRKGKGKGNPNRCPVCGKYMKGRGGNG